MEKIESDNESSIFRPFIGTCCKKETSDGELGIPCGDDDEDSDTEQTAREKEYLLAKNCKIAIKDIYLCTSMKRLKVRGIINFIIIIKEAVWYFSIAQGTIQKHEGSEVHNQIARIRKRHLEYAWSVLSR